MTSLIGLSKLDSLRFNHVALRPIPQSVGVLVICTAARKSVDKSKISFNFHRRIDSFFISHKLISEYMEEAVIVRFCCFYMFASKQDSFSGKMGNTHDTEIARIEADFIKTKYKTQSDYRWGYTGDRGQ